MQFNIESTKTTPKVSFDNELNLFVISGRSLVSDADLFYEPIFNWLELNVKNSITLEINLDYFNTSTHKHLLTMLNRLKDMNSDNEVCWYSEDEDEEMLEVGKKMEILSGMKFSYKNL